jgi:HAD superfamily hydrolase (TIGR01509 family)
MITHVFFDAGNTLVHLNVDLVAEVAGRRGARVSAQALAEAELAVRAEIDRPEIIASTTDHTRWLLYFEGMLGRCGVPGDLVAPVLEDLQRRHRTDNLWERVPEEVPRALDELRRRFRLSVVSNANGTVREKLLRVGLAGYFEAVLDSHEEGVEKPDPRIFRSAMERMGARPEASVYVGDIYHIDVAGARAAGMRAVLLDPAGAHADKAVPRIPTLDGLASCIDALGNAPL